MAFCGNCGTQVNDGVKFCPSCGGTVASGPATPPPFQQQPPAFQQAPVADEAKDAADNKMMGILSYLWLLVLIPIFTGEAKKSPFVKFHVNQGLTLSIAMIAGYIVVGILSFILALISWRLSFIGSLLYAVVGLGYFIFMVLGILSANNGEKKPLPVIGALLAKIQLIK